MKRIFAFIVAAMALSSCVKVGDTFLRFDGPKEVSAEEQELTYVPSKQAEMAFEVAHWTVFDAPSDQLPTEGNVEPAGAQEIIGDWFKVYFKDGNVIVELDANEGYKRELTVYIFDSVSTSGTSQFSVAQDGKVYGEE
jgi:hypothetical protein